MDQPGKAVTDEDLWEMIEDFVLMEVLRERLGEAPEFWDEMNDQG